MEDFLINMAFSTLFVFIKNAGKRKTMEAAFRKLYIKIGDAFPQFKEEQE